jgi:hypothetical protein
MLKKLLSLLLISIMLLSCTDRNITEPNITTEQSTVTNNKFIRGLYLEFSSATVIVTDSMKVFNYPCEDSLIVDIYIGEQKQRFYSKYFDKMKLYYLIK